MKFLTTFLIVGLFCQTLLGQAILQGTVKDTTGKALPNINIIIYSSRSSIVIAFAISDEKGYFKTVVNSSTESLIVKVSSVQYQNQLRHIANTSQSLHFRLVPDVVKLETIIIKAPPIEHHGDTISYLVRSFTKKEDRSIEDVLRHMPGIEVGSDGTILYQGLPLQKFYVEGLDLMNGRYGVVSENLPAASVSTVEILENHQPIRILKGRVVSQQASLNLKLKRNITTTGTATLGIGSSPFLWNANITPMMFTKNFQVAASYQTNNIGKDVSQQLKVKTLQDLLQNADRPAENPDLLKIQAGNPPDIAQNRYLDNNVHLLNFDGLLRIGHNLQLRTNLYYVNNKLRQQAVLRNTLYTPDDTISFIENMDNQVHENYLYGEFSLNRNVKDNYFDNKLKIQTRWDKQQGSVLTGNKNINQSLKKPLQAISNEMRSINTLGKKLIEFRSFMSYDNRPHDLTVIPGQFQGLFNQGKPYEKVIQQIILKRFYTDNSASMVYHWKKLSFTQRLGFAYRRQLLESNILITKDSSENNAWPRFINHLNGRYLRAYLHSEAEYQYKRLTVNVKLPLSWQQVHLNDSKSEKGQKINRFFIDPRVSANYHINSFWRMRGSWSYVHYLGDIDAVHYGFIMKNYRFLSQNAAPLSEISRNNFSAFFSYRNPITSFFNSVGYIYSIIHKNLMYSSIVQSDGTTVLQAFQLPNTIYSHNFHGQTSKYFSSAKTTVSFQVNFNSQKGKSLINGEMFDTKNLFYNFIPELNFHITSWLNADYNLNASYLKTFIKKERRSNISIFRHKFNIFAFPKKNQLISLSSEFYHLEGKNNFFMDISYRYTIIKKKVDFEFRWNNIFNSKTYTSYQTNTFTVWESTYILRPSQLFLSVRFSY